MEYVDHMNSYHYSIAVASIMERHTATRLVGDVGFATMHQPEWTMGRRTTEPGTVAVYLHTNRYAVPLLILLITNITVSNQYSMGHLRALAIDVIPLKCAPVQHDRPPLSSNPSKPVRPSKFVHTLLSLC